MLFQQNQTLFIKINYFKITSMANLFLKSRVINVVESFEQVQSFLSCNVKFIQFTEIYNDGFGNHDSFNYNKVIINRSKIIKVSE